MSGCKRNGAAASGKTAHIAIDPVTRIEGHLKADVTVENGKVVDAKLSGGMYRGFEQILRGRDPRDSSQIVQRICGVCPTAHATASIMAQDAAFGVKVTNNARITRNLILGANYLQSHLLHFYHLAAQDFVQGPDSAPFVPRYQKSDLLEDRSKDLKAVNAAAVDQYIEALDVRAVCHEMVAIWGGKMPHVQGLVAGGTTEMPTKDRILEYAVRFKKVRDFVNNKYLPTVYTVGSVYPDMFKVGQGHKACIAYGVFPLDNAYSKFMMKSGVYFDGKDHKFDPSKIHEDVKYSWFEDSTTGLHYSEGKTIPAPEKEGAYSFVKAPRYNGVACEVGPLARMWVENPPLSPVGQKMLKEKFGMDAKRFRDLGEDAAFSLMGRHVARAEESWYILDFIDAWLKEVKPDEETFTAYEIPESAEGTGFTEAPRGALLHYLDVKDSKINNYQIVSATLWNCNPRDDKGVRGPVEEALIGIPVPDIDNPVNVARLIRAFDP
ncbi:NiFeSe hydrogenase large subunit HysA [Halodesulfovibrio aestuarii]|uniref:Periplasmic [NiFe] hydrogenase large subunit n=1 Tax=Halodesulfovibrio aestuarii TaxID=126333 RepID=A0A8G2C8A3_9BACT|nr:NiFeSe hydrogenase large subunit HysA [Halodesulfovibrio aestuarii]SHI65635.1 hydrogenase large subunit [Halodesulfovibrio aestuarii]